MIQSVGKHILADIRGCNPEVLKSVETVEQIMCEATKLSNATIIGKYFKQFHPYGVSGVIIIEESHFSIHTWPEYGLATVDYYSCSDDVDMDKAIEYLKEKFQAREIDTSLFSRGDLKLLHYRGTHFIDFKKSIDEYIQKHEKEAKNEKMVL